MRPLVLGILALAVLGAACSKPVPTAVSEAPSDASDVSDQGKVAVEGGEGGAGPDENPAPGRLTGVPGIDRAQELDIKILDARGTGTLGGQPIVAGQNLVVATGQWLLSDAGSEYEITLRSALLLGVVRLAGRSAFLVEAPLANALPRFRVFAGRVSFYLPHLSGELRVLTPAGLLVTRGAVFTVTISPDSQVLVSCREGSVFLTGSQNAVAVPGQVLVADRLGRGRIYSMTPNEATVFADRWFKIMTEESEGILTATLPRRLSAWKAALALGDREQSRSLALWFREARTVLGVAVPGPETWAAPLASEVHPSVWATEVPNPGLLGELP